MEISPISQEIRPLYDVTVRPASPDYVINPTWRELLDAGQLAIHQVVVEAPRYPTLSVFIADDPAEVASGGHLAYIENWLLHIGFLLRTRWSHRDGAALGRAVFEPDSKSPEWFRSFRHGMDHVASRSDDGNGAAILYAEPFETGGIAGCQYVELQRTDVFDAGQRAAGTSRVAVAADAELDAADARALASLLTKAADRLEQTTGNAQ